MNFIYKNLFALPNLRPYTKHKKRIIPAIITGRISFFFFFCIIYRIHSAGLTVDPPTKTLCQKLEGSPESWGSGPPDPPVVAPLVIKDCARGIVLLKLTTDRREASRGLSVIAELLVLLSRRQRYSL